MSKPKNRRQSAPETPAGVVELPALSASRVYVSIPALLSYPIPDGESLDWSPGDCTDAQNDGVFAYGWKQFIGDAPSSAIEQGKALPDGTVAMRDETATESRVRRHGVFVAGDYRFGKGGAGGVDVRLAVARDLTARRIVAASESSTGKGVTLTAARKLVSSDPKEAFRTFCQATADFHGLPDGSGDALFMAEGNWPALESEIDAETVRKIAADKAAAAALDMSGFAGPTESLESVTAAMANPTGSA